MSGGDENEGAAQEESGSQIDGEQTTVVKSAIMSGYTECSYSLVRSIKRRDCFVFLCEPEPTGSTSFLQQALQIKQMVKIRLMTETGLCQS